MTHYRNWINNSFSLLGNNENVKCCHRPSFGHAWPSASGVRQKFAQAKGGSSAKPNFVANGSCGSKWWAISVEVLILIYITTKHTEFRGSRLFKN